MNVSPRGVNCANLFPRFDFRSRFRVIVFPRRLFPFTVNAHSGVSHHGYNVMYTVIIDVYAPRLPHNDNRFLRSYRRARRLRRSRERLSFPFFRLRVCYRLRKFWKSAYRRVCATFSDFYEFVKVYRNKTYLSSARIIIFARDLLATAASTISNQSYFPCRNDTD